jgi:hypothetical protein
MDVRFLKSFTGPDGAGTEGATETVPDDVGARMIAAGNAVEVPPAGATRRRVRFLKTFAGPDGAGSEGVVRKVPEALASRLIADGLAEEVPGEQHLSDAEQIDGPPAGTVMRSGFRPTAVQAEVNDALDPPDPPVSPPPPPAADATAARRVR